MSDRPQQYAGGHDHYQQVGWSGGQHHLVQQAQHSLPSSDVFVSPQQFPNPGPGQFSQQRFSPQQYAQQFPQEDPGQLVPQTDPGQFGPQQSPGQFNPQRDSRQSVPQQEA